MGEHGDIPVRLRARGPCSRSGTRRRGTGSPALPRGAAGLPGPVRPASGRTRDAPWFSSLVSARRGGRLSSSRRSAACVPALSQAGLRGRLRGQRLLHPVLCCTHLIRGDEQLCVTVHRDGEVVAGRRRRRSPSAVPGDPRRSARAAPSGRCGPPRGSTNLRQTPADREFVDRTRTRDRLVGVLGGRHGKHRLIGVGESAPPWRRGRLGPRVQASARGRVGASPRRAVRSGPGPRPGVAGWDRAAVQDGPPPGCRPRPPPSSPPQCMCAPNRARSLAESCHGRRSGAGGGRARAQ